MLELYPPNGSTGFALLELGRPTMPYRVKDRIRDALTQGGGVRFTARQFNISPAGVINIRRTMTTAQCTSG